MASSSSPSPASWAILARIPRACAGDAELPQGGEISLKLVPPPRVSLLDISPSIFQGEMTDKNFCSVLAAHPSGSLLLHATKGLASSPVSLNNPGHQRFLYPDFIHAFYICNPVSGKAFELPNPPDTIVDVGNLGLLVLPGSSGNYIVAELQPIIGSNCAVLLSFESESGQWHRKQLHYMLPLRPWGSHRVLSHNDKLWWVDVSWGLLSCDPSLCSPMLSFIALPKGKVLPFNSEGNDLERNRCVQISGGQIVFVEISEGIAYRPSVTIHRLRHFKMCRSTYSIRSWILVDPSSGLWKLNGCVEWTSLQKPSLAFIHPTSPSTIFFFLGKRLMSINMDTKNVEQSGDHKMIAPPSKLLSSRFVLPWELPPPLGLLLSGAGSVSNNEVSATPKSVSSTIFQAFHPSVGEDNMSE